MKRAHLLQVVEHLKDYKKINVIEKVADTIIKIVFNKGEAYFFDMSRGDSHIFQKRCYKKLRNYNSPFDVLLSKRFINAKIDKMEVMDGNRIFRIYVGSSSKYKLQSSILQFEFTGRNTNVIILDENLVILEAFRHIDLRNSFREIKVGVELEPLPPREFKESQEQILDIEEFLKQEYEKRELVKLEVVKKQKILIISKKLEKLEKLLSYLENEEDLLAKSESLQMNGNLILSNIHNMKNYQKEIEVLDFEGKSRVIQLPKDARTPAEAANRFFQRGKKLKQKSKNIHIERENLTYKITFLQRLKMTILSASAIDEVNLYLPKQPKKMKIKEKIDANIESFFIEGYKISLGKNQKGNMSLLKKAKMSDIWMHLKDMPSTHVIIKNEKKNVPSSVLEFASKLCVQFSATTEGGYLVDYTYRRNVKMRDGANVNYVDYNTIKAIKA